MVTFAIMTITLALLWYSIAVWAERIAKKLKEWHVVFFWCGFLSDSTGTTIMAMISKSYIFDIHGLSGPVALLLMLFHASWATYVIMKKNEKKINTFHKFSMFVWLIWLIPYISGMVMHMK
jgi:uncharacterized repeat protein (TIGR03987 family)